MANPMYRQIAEDLREQIESGQLPPGQQLRTELEMREHYEASRNTVRDAIKWLINLGLVEARPGQGTFVVQKIDPFVTTLSSYRTESGGGEGTSYTTEVNERNRKSSTSPVQVEIQEASAYLSAVLQIREDTEVIGRHERRFIDGIPWSMQTSSTLWSLRIGALSGSGAPGISRKEPSGTWPIPFTSARLATGTGSTCARRTPLRQTSSRCLRTAGLWFTRYGEPRSTRQVNPCGPRSPSIQRTGISSS